MSGLTEHYSLFLCLQSKEQLKYLKGFAMKYNIIINNMEFDVEVGTIQDGFAEIIVNNELFNTSIGDYQESAAPAPVARKAPQVAARRVQPAARVPEPAVKATPAVSGTGGGIKAPMPGLIIDIRVKEGDTIKPGQVVAVMEAMKMENDLPSAFSGTVKQICVQKGAQVATGDLLIVIG